MIEFVTSSGHWYVTERLIMDFRQEVNAYDRTDWNYAHADGDISGLETWKVRGSQIVAWRENPILNYNYADDSETEGATSETESDSLSDGVGRPGAS